MALGVAVKVKPGQARAEPRGTTAAVNARASAVVPLEVTSACVQPKYRHRSCSRRPHSVAE
jgi:hypothetical protein